MYQNNEPNMQYCYNKYTSLTKWEGMINIYKGVSHRVLLYVKHYRSYIQARAQREHVRAIQDPRTKWCHENAPAAWPRDIHSGGVVHTVYPMTFLSYSPLPSLSCPQLRIKPTLRNNKKNNTLVAHKTMTHDNTLEILLSPSKIKQMNTTFQNFEI